jgi:outer membrane receptor protein involved in Fe transport
MQMSRWIARAAVLLAIPLVAPVLGAQGVTTSGISARVIDANGNPKADARVVAVHQPSGTTYEARTRIDGRASLPNMRVGGPYRVTATALGAEPSVRDTVYLALGVPANLTFTLRTSAVRLTEVVVTAEGETVFSSDRTGAATSVGREAIKTLPTISGRIEDFVRLTPQYSGSGFGFSFAGQDNRMNNVTVDGAYFNNSFGLAGQPGDRTGVAPISMDAIEQVQVNIAPFDVRQGNFIGAGVNTVTRSGTNEYQGSVYYSWRDNRHGLHGTQANALAVNPGKFNFSKLGVSVGGPILHDKLFFFANYEDDGLTSPGTTFTSCPPTAPAGSCGTGNTTRVLSSDLDALATFLRDTLAYEPGEYQGYDFETPGTRYLARVDYNLNNRNKLSVRYNQLDSYTDVLLSNSSSLGFGSRRTNTTGLNFANSNYQILENIKSVVGEWNAMVGGNMSNNLIVGYEHHDESRGYKSSMFPFVDVMNGGSVYTSFGFEPFTPNNELRYNSTQVQNNFTIYGDKHELTFGVSGEKYHSENVFFQGAQSVYVYNSLADFYTDARAFATACGIDPANWSTCNRATSPVTLRTFQNAWTNIPGQTKPIQPLDVFYGGVYAQDQWRLRDNLKVTLGLRVDRPQFGNTAFQNDSVDLMTFRDENGASVKYSTAKLPDANLLFSPRLGFNWDIDNDKSFQLRGGTGVFTGRPAYVWISNQIGNNGVITGFERLDNTTARPFHPDPTHYDPATVTGAPAITYALALTDKNFKFPQLWRSNIAVDRRLPWGITGTGEFLYSKDVNGMYYINANLPAPDSTFLGPDQRVRWVTDKCATTPIGGVNQFTGTERDRLNCTVTNAIVLKNSDAGFAWNFSGSLEKPFGLGTFVKVAYSYGVSKSFVDPGSIASGSWQGNQHSGNPNTPALGYAATSPGHRLFGAASKRINLFPIGPTTASLFWEARTIGNASYTVSGDLNGDAGTGNDLIYIPRDTSEMFFQQFTASGRTFTVLEQKLAWEAYIQQDEYLSSRRGQYAERGGVFLPMFNRADFSIVQDVARAIGGRQNSLQFRLDFLNFGNLLNHRWGVSQRMVNTQPLVLGTPGVDPATRQPVYRLRNIGNQLISKSFEQTAGTGDVYRIQMTVRYNFN